MQAWSVKNKCKSNGLGQVKTTLSRPIFLQYANFYFPPVVLPDAFFTGAFAFARVALIGAES